LAASIAGFSAAAAGVVRAATEESAESTELLTRALRAAAREEPGRPLVCLVDDAAWLASTWCADGILEDALTELSRRLEALRGDRGRGGDDLLRETLAFGALEGRRFTAAAVARALNHDQNEVEDLLDELVAEVPEEGILRPPWLLKVQDLPHGGHRVMWRYEFTNSLLWRAARERLSDLPSKTAAAQMVDAVVASFGGEAPLILPTLARLADLAGDPSRAARYRALITSPSVAAMAAQARPPHDH
jgi:hypothetical protein